MSYGAVIYAARRLLESTFNKYWELRSVDLVEAIKDIMPKEGRINIIDQLITNHQKLLIE